MKPHFFILSIFSIFAAGSSLTGCKGRTADNMIPDGDTIEVVINQQDQIVEQLPDSIVSNDSL